MTGRRRALLLAIIAFGVAVGVATVMGDRNQDRSMEPGHTAMVVGQFQYLDGPASTIESFRGQPLVINFFGSWCAPCRAEMPEFEAVHQRVADDVGFLGLAVQDTREDARALVDATAVTYPVGMDTANLAADLATMAMPTTVFVDRDGQVVATELGQISGDQLLERIEALFGIVPP